MVKNKLFLVLFIAGVLLTLFLGKPVSQMPTGEVINLIVSNAGFEGGNGGDAYSWTETANIKRTDSKFRSGSYSMIAKYTMALYAGQASLSNAIDVQPNTKYILSGYIYNRFMQGQAYLDVKAYGGLNDPSWSCDAKSTLDSCEWQYVSCEFTTPSGVTKVQIRAIADKYPWGMSWFDDIELITEEDRCSDSDNGEVVEILGTVTEYRDGLPSSYTDYCRTDGYLNEYYCQGTRMYDRAYDCTSSTGAPCADGVCTTTTTTTSTTTTTLPSYYDDFSSSSLDSNKWEIRQDIEGQPLMEEFYVDSSLKNYHTKQNTIADRRVFLVPKHKFKAGDSIEYDVDVISKEGHYGNIILLVGEECSRCALGMVGYNNGPQPYDELGVSHIELTFFSDKLQIIREAPSGQIFSEDFALQNPEGAYELYIGSFSGHNGIAHIDYDNFIITPPPTFQTQTQVFYDDFESDLGKWIIRTGSSTLTTNQFYKGLKSLYVPAESRLEGPTSVTDNGVVEAYFFDSLLNDGHNIGINIAVGTYNGPIGRIEIVPGVSNTYYAVRSSLATSVARTYGWHKARFELNNNYLKTYIDNVLVDEMVPRLSYFDRVALLNTGPGSPIIYFDSLYVYQTTQTSQATLDYARTIASMPPPPPSATNSTG